MELAMTITLNTEQERLLSEVVQAGFAHTPEEAVDKAVRALHSRTVRTIPAPRRESRIRQLRQGLSLGDLSIRNLIDEGRE
jgi:hypothetical protein